MKKKITFIPYADKKNPYQILTKKYLKSKGFYITKQYNGKIFPFSINYILFKPDYYYIDWISRYIINKNLIIQIVKSVLFLMDIFLVKTLTSSKVIFNFHNLKNHENIHVNYENIINKIFYRYVDRFRVFNSNMKNYIVKSYNINDSKITICPLPSYINYYRVNLTIDSKEAKKRLNIDKNSIVFLFIGNIRRYKGIVEFARLFSNIKEKKRILLIAGRPFDKNINQQLINIVGRTNNIVYHPGFVADNKLHLYFSAADVVILPFKDVFNSASLLLAMSFKKAIITKKTKSIEEYLIMQKQLLYSDQKELVSIIKNIKKYDLADIGEKNYLFIKAQRNNSLLSLFE